MAILDLIYNSPVRIKIAEMLSYKILPWLDSWTLVHFLAGIFFMFVLVKIFKDQDRRVSMIILTVLLVVYEFLELYWFQTANRFFTTETLFNQMFDLVIGVIGGYVFLLIDKSKKR